MSTAKLNVWITDFGDACHIVKPRDLSPGVPERWFVHITDCTGNVLEWCGKKFSFLEAKCGHLEIEIPPGCYSVFATHTAQQSQGRQPFGNQLTHIQVVRANCGDHVCVTLFSPKMSSCGSWFVAAVNSHHGAFTAAQRVLAMAAVKAVGAFVAKLEADTFGANVTRLLQQDPPR